METNTTELGLTTKDALNKLYMEIEIVLKQFQLSQKSRKTKSWIKDTLQFSSQHTTFNCISIGFQLWCAFSLIITYFLTENSNLVIFETFIVFILLIINLTIVLYDNRLRHNEIPNRVRTVLDKLKKSMQKIKWQKDNYPHLCSPLSPCISLQWTYRDNTLVNLPWSLLVKDDVILIRPGQASPGFCESIEKNSEFPLLHAKEIYAPSLQSPNEVFNMPKLRKPLEPKKYRLLETPYLNNLRIFLEQALDRPISRHNQQRHLIMIKTIERILLPFSFLLAVFVNLLRYFYLHSYIGRYSIDSTFLVGPTNVILPLLPLIFPLVWIILNNVGLARFKTIVDVTRNMQTKEDPFDEDNDNTIVEQIDLKIRSKDVWKNVIDVFMGRSNILGRSTNIVHVLGSVTALGCVDKKGILSWPNPTAEKVFFLHNNGSGSPESSLGNVGDLGQDPDNSGNTAYHFHPDSPITATAEVLDLTHNHTDPFKLHFDDHQWQKYLPSLKPLGLAILLNTCNTDTQEHYAAFCSHITCEAIYNENLIPVTNRRCLCELAKEIGFVNQAEKIFSLEQQLSTFRHLQPEIVRRDYKYARSLQLSTKLKFPFPHMFAVVVKELCSGSMQLLSEGTADIIVDSCVDYWDGCDLCPLSHSDRKKIQDFYQRSSLTAYCTAFAYRPLTKCISHKMSEVYLELPRDSQHLYMSHRSPTPAHWDCKSVLEPKIKTNLGPFYSTDSLLYNDCPIGDVNDAESCFQMQCNQIFIGMVTMQYQPLMDMIHLIEQLERACIRFVHFSKENELRSRVFSEKMGLESGWNCHISLLSERNRRDSGQMDSRNKCKTSPRIQHTQRRLSQSVKKLEISSNYDDKSILISNLESSRTMSFSAPSAINMDHSIVKFDTEVEKFNINKKNSDEFNDNTSHESIPLNKTDINNSTTHDWQSLSCLTDSTEQSAPINFDMSNRAKLPRGIDKIRPHIELIDNVPLLVSLFTDCTATAIREMLNIMQDYNEVVCIIGSSENCDNAGIFMQADASIAIEPLYPQVCQRRDVYRKTSNSNQFATPLELSCDLNSLPCSLTVRRQEPISFYHLIMESRHFVTILWSSIQYWLCCCVLLNLLQLLCNVFMLPMILTTSQVLWFACIVIPLISISLMVQTVEQDVMKKPQGKFQMNLKMNVINFMFWCYGTKFLPTIVIVLVCYIGILGSHCIEMCEITNNCTCAFFYNPIISNQETGWKENSWTLLTARLVVVFLVLIHFVVISIGFINRNYLVHQKWPFKQFWWLITIFILLLIQSIYTILQYNSVKNSIDESFQFNIPLWVIIFAAISPFIVFITNEVIKSQEIIVNQRFLKRARLDFGTKLGMNSPF